jgi:manganese efflux pump family protein
MNKLKERWNIKSNWQLTLILIVFAITGSTAAYLSKPVTSSLGISKENLSLWLYWPFRLLIIFPVYQVLLVIIGALFGQFTFFWEFEKKMLDRMKLGFISKYVDSKLKK